MNIMEKFVMNLQSDYRSFSESSTKSQTDHILKGLGVVGWTICYIGIVLSHQDMPVSILVPDLVAYNIVWEFVRTFIWNTNDQGWLFWLMGIGWCGIDLLICWKVWTSSDGFLEVAEGRLVFQTFVVFYLLVSFLVHRAGESMSRIWRHLSYFWGMRIQLGILYHFYVQTPGMNYMHSQLVGSSIGNFCYLASVRGSYDKWTDPYRHPIQFSIMFFEFLPTILLSFYSMYCSYVGRVDYMFGL